MRVLHHVHVACGTKRHHYSPASRDAANRCGIRPSQLKSGMAQASQARGFTDAVAAPSTPNFLVEADGITPSSTAAARAPMRASSLAFGGAAAAGR
jgi:hypothetical protein